jgi:hypothetical protein
MHSFINDGEERMSFGRISSLSVYDSTRILVVCRQWNIAILGCMDSIGHPSGRFGEFVSQKEDVKQFNLIVSLID